MQFAIQRLILSSVVPSTLFCGIAVTELFAQQPSEFAEQPRPSTSTHVYSVPRLIPSGGATRGRIGQVPPSRQTPKVQSSFQPVAKIQNSHELRVGPVPNGVSVPPRVAHITGSNTSRQRRTMSTEVRSIPTQSGKPQIIQTANQAVPGNASGESEVQAQLRKLYEKSGQEMPVMDLDAIEVPEPQPGVAPGSLPPQAGGGAPGMIAPQQPQTAPAKAPNFFERVFLGKKSPPPAPVAPPQRPLNQNPNMYRPGPSPQTPGTVPPGAGAASTGRPGPNGANGYRPYTPQANGPGRPVTPPGNPAGGQALQRPQQNQQFNVQPQMPSQVQPKAAPVSNQAQPPSNPNQSEQPANVVELENGSSVPGNGQQPAAVQNRTVPLLDEEPEESLDIDLTPKANTAPSARAAQSDGTGGTLSGGGTSRASSDQPAVEDNPFSGLRLQLPDPSLPQPAQQKPVQRSAPTAPVQTLPRTRPQTVVPPPAPEPAAAFEPPILKMPPDFQVERSSSTSSTAIAPVNTPSDASLAPKAAAKSAASVTEGTTVKKTDVPTQEDFGSPFQLPSLRPAATATSPRSAQGPDLGSKAIAPSSEIPKLSLPESSAADEVPVISKGHSVAPQQKFDLAENMRKLSEAVEKKGLKGFCPVALRLRRQLIEVKPQFHAAYQGKKYHLSSIDAKSIFESNPFLFAPAHDGLDGVALLDDEKPVDGSLDHAAWYQGRLFLFSSRDNLQKFHAEPDDYLDESGLEETLNKVMSDPSRLKPLQSKSDSVTTEPEKGARGRTTPSRRSPNNLNPETGAQKRTGPELELISPRTQPRSMTAPRTSTPQAASQRSAKKRTPSMSIYDELPVLTDTLDNLEPIHPPAAVAMPDTDATLPKLDALPPTQLTPTIVTAPSSATTARTQSTVTQQIVTEPNTVDVKPEPSAPQLSGNTTPASVTTSEGVSGQSPAQGTVSPVKSSEAAPTSSSSKQLPEPKLIRPAPRLIKPSTAKQG